MRLPLVPRSELAQARSEVAAWRRRAESQLWEDESPKHARRRSRRVSRIRRVGSLATASFATAAIAVAALTLPGRTNGAAADYSACIGKARYEHPIEQNQYQELVNALYTCGVYRLP